MKKLKKRISLVLAVPAFIVFSIVNVQLTGFGTNSTNARGVSVTPETACAGPCANRGCEGDTGVCDSYTVIEIGNIVITRTCTGEKIEEEPATP